MRTLRLAFVSSFDHTIQDIALHLQPQTIVQRFRFAPVRTMPSVGIENSPHCYAPCVDKESTKRPVDS